jgi:hypothetical protein
LVLAIKVNNNRDGSGFLPSQNGQHEATRRGNLCVRRGLASRWSALRQRREIQHQKQKPSMKGKPKQNHPRPRRGPASRWPALQGWPSARARNYPALLAKSDPLRPPGRNRLPARPMAPVGLWAPGRQTGSGRTNGLRENEATRWCSPLPCPRANRVLGVAHFCRAQMDHSWRAPRVDREHGERTPTWRRINMAPPPIASEGA